MGIDRMSTAARIDELLSKFDENPRRYFAPLANEYRKAGDLTQAIALCREHLPKQPGHMSGHIVFGQALFEFGDLAEAQTVFEAALALDPENLIALRHLGDIARGRGDAPLARRWYGRVLEADPRNDDIAALLASLPVRATPMSTPAVAANAAAALDEPPAASEPFVDEPAWHTPAILGGYVEPKREGATAAAEPELLDLDSPVEPAVEVPMFFETKAAADTTLDDAFGAEAAPEPEPEVAFDALLELAAPEAPAVPEAAFEPLPLEAIAAETVTDTWSIDADLHAEAPRDSLSDAIDAFESHDPLDSAAAPVIEAELDDAARDPFSTDAHTLDGDAPAASATEYGDGLDDIEWPDASQLSALTPSPMRSVTPVVSWSPVAESPAAEPVESALEVSSDVADEPLVVDSLVQPPVEAGETEVAVDSLLDAPVEAEEWDVAVESLIDAPVEAEEWDVAVESLVDAPVEAEESELAVESLIDAPVEAEESDFAVESSIDAPAADEVGAFSDEALAEAPVEAEEAPCADEATVEMSADVEVGAEALADTTAGAVVLDSDEPDDAAPTALLDEDPPYSAGAMPWLMTSEEEREAEDAELLESSALPESPAFVTETMAELLVGQGFVARAIDVYEELVVRRPDDEALRGRLATLRASVEPELAIAESVETEAPIVPAFSATPAAPFAAFTPARSSTPRAVPFIAPAPRRTAREWLSLLSAMQVARRTPVVSQVLVSMPTPADGLASLFGASPLPADDVAARSLATAYGGAVPLDSSAPLFASGDFTLPAESPREPEAAAPSEPANGSSVYSFDRFFPDPATTAGGPTASSDAPAATSSSASHSDDPTSPGADLAQFSHWLKGLSNS